MSGVDTDGVEVVVVTSFLHHSNGAYLAQDSSSLLELLSQAKLIHEAFCQIPLLGDPGFGHRGFRIFQIPEGILHLNGASICFDVGVDYAFTEQEVGIVDLLVLRVLLFDNTDLELESRV